MKILARNKLKAPINLIAGDSVNVTYVRLDGTKEYLVGAPVGTSLTVDEAAVFATEFEGRRAIGGMVLEQK